VDRELKRVGNIDESSEAHSSVVFRFALFRDVSRPVRGLRMVAAAETQRPWSSCVGQKGPPEPDVEFWG